jgi:hypothetical protein
MAVTVKFDDSNPAFKYNLWVVMDDGYVYDRYATEDEAKTVAHKLIEEQRLHDAIESELEELVGNICGRFGITYNVAKKHIKQTAEHF